MKTKTSKATTGRTRTPARGRTTAPAKPARATKAGVETAKAVREKRALLTCLRSLGLLAEDSVERLELKAEKLLAAGTDGLAQASGWDHALTATLNDFVADGGDGRASDSLHALIVWHNAIMNLPGTVESLRDAIVSLRKVVPHDGASLFLRDPDAATVAPLLHHGIEVELIGRIRFTEGQGFSSWVAGHKRPVLYTSVHRNEAPNAALVRSFMAVPLVVGSECLGVLQLGSLKDGTFTPRTLRVLILAGSMLAGLVQRYVSVGQLAAREIHDAATGLATPEYLRSRVEEEVVRCRELGHSMSVVTFRLAGLEEHVERFGRDYLERCRQDLASLVALWRGPAELVSLDAEARILALLPSQRRERAEERAGVLAGLIERHNFPRRKKMALRAGIAAYPADADDAQGLLSQADNDLYESLRVEQERPAALESVALS